MSHPPPRPAEDADLSGTLRANLQLLTARLESASGPSAAPALIAVTKSVGPAVALALSQLLPQPSQLGENRAEILARKRAAFDAANQPARWHFIGHIQRNKARRIIEGSDVLHSIDSLRLAQTVVRLAAELERSLEVFIEVNLTGETEKHGLGADEVAPVLEALNASDHVQVAGLMAMGPARGLRTVDEVFADVAQLAAELEGASPGAFIDGRCRLSMGMSGDLEAAVSHGSHFVRVGSALFDGIPDEARDLPSSSPENVPR